MLEAGGTRSRIEGSTLLTKRLYTSSPKAAQIVFLVSIRREILLTTIASARPSTSALAWWSWSDFCQAF